MVITQPHLKRRFLAGLIDYLFIYGLFYAFALYYGSPNESGGYSVTGSAALVPIIFWMVLTVGLEQVTGATLGNGIAGLKPLDADGRHNPDVFQSLKRHLLDPIDMLFFGIIAIIAIKNSPKHQRLGDQWAKTIVVRA